MKRMDNQHMGNLNLDNYKGPTYPVTINRSPKGEVVTLADDTKRDQWLQDLTTNGYIVCRDENGNVPFVFGFGGIEHLAETITNDTNRSASRR
jgi:hypothetical protein